MSASATTLITVVVALTSADSGYPESVCFNGDVQADYTTQRDPRTLMGTYSKLDDNTLLELVLNTTIIDPTAPIYQHTYQIDYTIEGSTSQYLFKANNIGSGGESTGWCLSESLPAPNEVVTVFMTCFEDNLFDCQYNQWYWGYDGYEYSIPTVKVMGNECQSNFCIRNLTIQLKYNPAEYTRLDGEFILSNETKEGRSLFVHKNDPNKEWFFRINAEEISGNIEYTYNWVYSDNGDRVACAPGYVDSPLYCTTFVYAGTYENRTSLNPQMSRYRLGQAEIDGGITDFKMGTCDYTPSPTTEPTMEPTLRDGPITCTYDSVTYNAGDTIEVQCEFGYYGTMNTGECLSNGIIDWVQGCFKISIYDDFREDSLNEELWTVYSPDTGVPRDAALSVDGSDSLRFIPDAGGYVEVIRSTQQINYPIRARAIVEKRVDECNLFSIGMGPTWRTRQEYTTRVNWGCYIGINYNSDFNQRQLSLYNATFRLYDATCWNDAYNETDTMDVVYSVGNKDLGYDYGYGEGQDGRGSEVTTSISNCAPLRLINDMFNQTPWENSYLYFGTYNDDDDIEQYNNKTIIGRFDAIGYTRFFTDFSDFNVDASIMDIFNEGNSGILSSGDKLTSNDDYYQFTIPFMIKLGVYKPTDGAYAQYLSLGGDGDYTQDVSDGVVQIVWDGDKKQRLVYTTNGIYYNPNEICSWDTERETFDVSISIDSENIRISSEFCDNVLVAAHDLDANQMSLSLGAKGSSETTQFAYIEVYQYPSSYEGSVGNGDTLSNLVTDIDNLTSIPSESPTPAPSDTPYPTPQPTRTSCSTNAECILANGKNYQCELESNGGFCYYSECSKDVDCISGLCNVDADTYDEVVYAFGICAVEPVGNNTQTKNVLFNLLFLVVVYLFS